MTEKRVLALLALVLGLVGGVLLLVAAVSVRGNQTITLEFLLERGVQILVALAILFGSLLIYREQHSTGGILNLVLGIVALVLSYDTIGSVLALTSGLMGIVASQGTK